MGCQAGRFRILEFGFWIGCSNDFGFWILDFRLGALPKLNTQSKIQIPKSKITGVVSFDCFRQLPDGFLDLRQLLPLPGKLCRR